MTRANIGLAMACLLAVACVRNGSRAPVGDRSGASPSPSVAAGDQEVLDFVLADLATYVGDDSPVAVRGAVPVPLSVAPDSVDWPVTVDDALYRHDARWWKSLSPPYEPVLAQAAADLVARTTGHAGFTQFRSRDSRVNVAKPEEPPQQQYQFLENRPIRAWPPGFSVDRQLVLVRMSIPWSIHHANATYVLAKRQGSWTMLVRQFVYYP